MKKLLTVLCVAAFGMGAVAQAQVVQANAERMEAKELNKEVPATMPDFSVFGNVQGQLQAEAVKYDTLRWHDEYVTPDCKGYYSIVEYYDDLYSKSVVPSPFGATWSGTGEVGATYQTKYNLYDTYARINLDNAWVVGAVAYVYRRGSLDGWGRIGDDINRYAEHMSEANGQAIPDMPCRIMGYAGDKVARQTAYANYYDMLFEGDEPAEIVMEMPITMQGRFQTDTTLYVRYLEPEDGWPGVHRIGGMFDGQFIANDNFGLSIQAEYTNNQRYDSLWNWAVAAKGTNKCSLVDAWASWVRLNCYNVDSGWCWLKLNSGDPMDVSLPYNSDDTVSFGLAPDYCPQYGNEHSLYIYAFSMNMGLSEGTHFLPWMYPIIQYSSVANENKDAYAQTVSVYPLPATDKVNVVAIDPMQKVEIYNMAGTLVKAIEMNDNSLEINVTSFVPGTYVAKITTDKGTASKKLLVR